MEGAYAPPASAEIFNTNLQSVRTFELRVNQSTQIPLEPGNYFIRASLPSGELINQQTTVGDGIQRIELRASDSPHEWLSWQHYLGDLGSQASAVTPIPPEVRRSTWLRLWVFEAGEWRVEKADKTGLFVKNQDPTCFQVQGYFAPDRLRLLQLGGDFIPHRMIALPPAPGPMDILIRTTRRNLKLNGGIVARIASFDTATETLLRYIASGACAAAETMGGEMTEGTFSGLTVQDHAYLDQAESWAKAKLVNPNGAAVGFYYLLQRTAYNRLHDWPDNFANWFPWLPDASIIHAMQLLYDPEHRDLDQATSRLIQAATAGIPVYTAGLRYLYDNLCACVLGKQTVAVPPHASKAFQRIRDVASAVDWTEARTTIYGPDPSLPSCSRTTGIPKDLGDLWFLEKS